MSRLGGRAPLLLIALLLAAPRFDAAPRQASATLNLMPVPASVHVAEGRVPVDASFTVARSGHDEARLRSGLGRFLRRLQGRTGDVLTRSPAADPGSATLWVDVAAASPAIPGLGDDESYRIDSTGGQLRLTAGTVVGALRGLETALQLLSGDRQGFFWPAVTIDDRPRFRWRGLLIDVGRHFEPVEVIERNLDAMAAVKLNVLHFHLSEDQGFRVESRKFPRLHELGSDGQYYTQDELRHLVSYAAERGIRVVPEFDMPGHVTSWVVGYPELASAPGPYTLIRRWGVFDAAFDPTRDETYKFIDTFIGEMAPIFPDAYWHIGGDENNGKQWAANPKIQAFMAKHGLADAHALQTYFNQRLLTILRRHGKRMMGWDEILQPGLPDETVVHSWRGAKGLTDAAKLGYDAVLSAGYYIDLMNTAAAHYAVDPLPADSSLTDEQAARVLGGEATMWGEWVGPETIDSRIWPRTAAIAERLWSPREVTDVDDMYRRLARVSGELEDLGLTHLRNRGVLLRRLAAGQPAWPLEALADVVEPVKGYRRGGQQPEMTSLGPLTHLVDAVGADSPGARATRAAIAALLDDAPRFALGRDALTDRFSAWRDAAAGFDRLAARAPALREVAPLAADLGAMGVVGLDALGFLAEDVPPPDGWRDAAIGVLDEAARPKAALEFPAVPLLRELVEGAAMTADLRAMTPADWRAAVRAKAAPPRRGRGGGD